MDVEDLDAEWVQTSGEYATQVPPVSPGGLTVSTDNRGGLRLSWTRPEIDLSEIGGYVVEYKNADGVTRTHQVNAARQGTRLPGPNVHIDRLDTGEAYSVRVGTVHRVSGQDDVMAWTGWTDYTTPRYDNLQFWYGGDTPMLNNGRIWVSPTTNLDNVSGTCWLSSAALNCPPGGLYSERVNRGARGTLEPRPP